MSKARDLADLISTGGILADGAVSVSEISDLTATAAELNTLDGITASTADLNNVAGINSDVQTQLDLKAPLASPTFTGDATFDTDTLAVDSTNNRVGIGTSSPDSKLHVNNSTGHGEIISEGTSSHTGYLYLQAGRTAGTGSTCGAIQFRNTSNSNEVLAALNAQANRTLTVSTNGSEAMRIDSSGNVGIGTSSPATNLTVTSATSNGSGGDSQGMIQAYYTGTSNGNASLVSKNYYGTMQFMAWEDNGLRIGSRVVTNGGSGEVVFTAGNDSEKFRIGSSGELGIGGATYGTAGQVLTSGGSGAAPTWADAAAGGAAFSAF